MGPLLFIAWLGWGWTAPLCPSKDAGGWGVDETFLCPEGILRGPLCLLGVNNAMKGY